jgi:ATP-binding cassette subfamily B multidrug efflux pump
MKTFFRSLRYVRPYLLLAIGALLSLLLVTGANLYSPQLIRQLIDGGITGRNWNVIIFTTAALLGVAVVRGLFTFAQSYWSEQLSQNFAYDFRNDIYGKLQNLSFSYHDSHQTGQLMTRVTSDVEAVRLFYAQGLLNFVSALVTFFGSAAILFSTDWRLALAALSTIPVVGIVFGILFSRLFPMFGRAQAKLGALNTVLQENLAGVRVVKAFAAESHELERYRKQNNELYLEFLNVVRSFSWGFPFVFFFANLGSLIVIWYGGNLVISQELSLGTLIAFNTYLSFLLFPIFQLGFISQLLGRAGASAVRLYEIIDAESDVLDKANAKPLSNIQGRVEFKEVHFRYLGSDTEVLKGVSFVVESGQTVAILGSTGSGKSTIINLIPRFYNATAGQVLVDGYDVKDVTLESLRSHIGIVLQDVNLVHGTIRDNIKFGAPNATDADVERAARTAQAHEFILAQPNGYDTMVGERGVGLSGGQKQRVAIARALLVNPRILIFDDSTSAVDAETEYLIQQALQTLMTGRTSFVIAQRISTVRNADLILVLDAGQVVAQGKHADLMEDSPIYAEILASQFADELKGIAIP